MTDRSEVYDPVLSISEMCQDGNISRDTWYRVYRQRVRLWRDRFKADGVAGLREDRRRAAPLTAEQLQEIGHLAIYGLEVAGSPWTDATGKRHEPRYRERQTAPLIAARLGLSARRVTEALRDELGLKYRSGRWWRGRW